LKHIEVNPAEGLNRPKQSPSRERVLSEHELRLVWQAAASLGWPFDPILKLLALTGQRKSEITAGRWSEIDLEAMVWRLPSNRTKNKRPHAFPLSSAVLA
jgi:integrase